MRIELTELKRRRWLFRRRRVAFAVPTKWDEVTPARRRERWWKWLITKPRSEAVQSMLRDLMPRWALSQMSVLDLSSIASLLDWVNVDEPNCTQVALPSVTHAECTYFFPKPLGENITCLEFVFADEYYQQFAAGDTSALTRLSATLWREGANDLAWALRRGDPRAALFSRDEVTHRADKLAKMPAEAHVQALVYFEGLKSLVYKTYGGWIFEEPEESDDEEGTPAPTPSSPDFGWFGVFQSVAESQVFGDIDKVYQTCLHDVCAFLVRKRVEANKVTPEPSTNTNDDDNLQ